jgi:hypothetical protein
MDSHSEIEKVYQDTSLAAGNDCFIKKGNYTG